MKTKRMKNTHKANKKAPGEKICVLDTCIPLYLIKLPLYLLARDDQDDLGIICPSQCLGLYYFPFNSMSERCCDAVQ